jgi:trimethylamine--corrinoid protein Co-methyltransferase
LHELYLALASTGKHVQTVTVVDTVQAGVAVEIARAVAGGEREAREHPPISALLGTVTPLGNDEGTLEAALAFAAAGIPVGFVTMPMGGSTTPITMAGSLAVGIAEVLADVDVVQAAHPGAPVFISLIPSIMDLKTGDFTGGAPEDTLMGAAAGDIGEFYGLPTQCGVNASGAKEPGWQTAMEDVTTTFVSMAAGVDMLTGVGMVAGGRVFSFAEVLLGAEVTGVARAMVSGTTDRSSVEVRLELVGRDSGSDAAIDGDVSGVAQERVRQLLSTHAPPKLDEALNEEIRALVEGRS